MTAIFHVLSTLAVLLGAEPLYAQIGGDGKFGRMFEESYEDDFRGDPEEPLTETEQGEELSPDHRQMRTEKDHILSLFVGQAMAWQTYGLHLSVQNDEHSAYVYSAGTGAWDLKSEKMGIDFEFDLRSRGIFASIRHFPTTSGLFLQASAGWLFWQGTVNPAGQGATELPEIVKSGVHANGMSASVNIGYSFVWMSGWVFEYSMVGFSKAHLTYTDFTHSNGTSRTVLRETIEGWTNWGLFNLSIGHAI